MRAVVAIIGLFSLLIGLGFLLNPEKLAAAVFIAPVGTQGLATLRADFTGFFIGVSLFAIYGAWKGDAKVLLVPLVMLGLALLGRMISMARDGIVATTAAPIVIELVMVASLLLAQRVFSKPAG